MQMKIQKEIKQKEMLVAKQGSHLPVPQRARNLSPLLVKRKSSTIPFIVL